MNKLALMTGVDIPIIEMQLAIHQPTIKEISYLGEEEFFVKGFLISMFLDVALGKNPRNIPS